MTAPQARGFLVTFTPCGHVQHSCGNPPAGSWLSCWWAPRRNGCQTSRQVVKSEPCPGCPDCPGQAPPAAGWVQASLFDGPGRAA